MSNSGRLNASEIIIARVPLSLEQTEQAVLLNREWNVMIHHAEYISILFL